MPATSSTFTSTKSPIAKPTVSSFHKKQKMTLTQTYYLAHTARGKLSKEAARADHDLRLLVGHANLLDGLMVDLADAEREQESWFNQSVSKAADEPKHIRFAEIEALPRVVEDYEDDSSDDSEDDDTEEIDYAPAAPLRRVPSTPTTVTTTEMEIDSDEEFEDDDEDYTLQLVRSPSHASSRSSRTPPELLHESDSESEDESMPLSPPAQPEITLDAFSAKQKSIALHPSKAQSPSILPPTSQDDADSFYEEGYYLPQRQSVVVY